MFVCQSSAKDVSVSVYECQKERITLNHQNVGSSPNKCRQWVIFLWNVKIDVQAKQFGTFEAAKNIFNHLHVYFASLQIFFLCRLGTHLDSGRIWRRVAILEGRDEHDIFEMRKTVIFGQFIQIALLFVWGISHGQLLNGRTSLEILYKPHACAHQRIWVVHVAEMGRAQTHIPVHFWLKTFQVFQRLPHDDAAKRVPHETQFTQAYLPSHPLNFSESAQISEDKFVDFSGQFSTEIFNPSVCVLLVGLRNQKHRVW